jgi:maltose O-acetyltransferase
MNRGLKVGKNVYIFQDVEFDSGYPFLIEIGDNCRIGKNVLILAHDATTFKELGITRLAPVKILEGSFIGQRAVILPGVTIGPRAMVAAGSVVNRSVPEGRAVAGNPARPYTTYAEILERVGSDARDENIFDFGDIETGSLTADAIKERIDRDGIAFVKTVPSNDPFYVNTDMGEIRRKAEDHYAKFISVSRNNQKQD